MVDALRVVLQLVDLTIDLVEPDAVPASIAGEGCDLQRRHVVSAAARRRHDDFQDAVVNGRRPEQGIIEVETCDPETVRLDEAGRDAGGPLCNWFDVDGPARPVTEFFCLARIDRSEEIIERAFNIRVGCYGGEARSWPMRRAQPASRASVGSLRSRLSRGLVFP